MAPNAKVAMAFRAMKVLGITEETVKPVLKNLLRLYDRNWELIEEENYRVLADAIFDYEETKAAEDKKKKFESIDRVNDKKEEAQVHDEPERPLKRLRLRHQDDQVSPSVGNSSLVLGETSVRRPKLGQAEPPQTCSRQEIPELSQLYFGDKRAEPESVSPRTHLRDKGKKPVSPQTCGEERAEPYQLCHRDRRTESDSFSPQIHLRAKGKESVSPQIAPSEKRSISERTSRGVCFKEPKIEPGIVLLPKERRSNNHQYDGLIKPKHEPFTDDLPQFEVPIAVIHPALPDPLYKDASPIGNDSIGEEDDLEPLASQSVVAEDNGNGVSDSARMTTTNCELVNIPEASPAIFEIASSPLGEVKVSLSCNSTLEQPHFRMPTLDAVLKRFEDKCLKSYRIIEPSFSAMKLMKEFCECVVEVGTDFTDGKQEGSINITPALELVRKPNARNALGSGGNFCMPESYTNGSLGFQSSTELGVPHIPRFLALNGLDDIHQIIQPKKKVLGNCNDERAKKKELDCPESSSSRSLVVVQQHQLTLDDVRFLHDVNDITKGEERVKISLVNEISSEYPHTFYYIPQNIVYQQACVNISLARIANENCCAHCFGDCISSSIPCACARETGGEFAYTLEGLVKEDFLNECISMSRDPQKHRLFYCKDCPLERSKNEDMLDPCKGHLVRKFIKECWSKCGCNKRCGNRVVQRGIECNFQVFLTSEGKGWGLRTLEDLPKGAFVCEYVGEILTNTELYERNMRSTGAGKHTYPVLLDADWGSEGGLKDEDALCLDATYYGNAARFINHRCFDANLVEIPVEVETPDHHYYHLAFFTTRKVDALEELTWDYGIDFDDHDHPVKAFRCRCGSKSCRDMKRPSRTKASALVLR